MRIGARGVRFWLALKVALVAAAFWIAAFERDFAKAAFFLLVAVHIVVEEN